MGRRPRSGEGPSGLLLVDKPAGLSSAAVVARVRRVLGGVKAGHTGTLDPFATGLLPLALGEGTKLATYLTASDKAYEGVIALGTCTDTHDRTGAVTATAAVPPLDDARLDEVAADFRGSIAQVPPVHSALKRGGRPMYELARRGEAPELDPRPAMVHRLQLRLIAPDRVAVEVECSKGFYVRSLARDLGEALGCGAMLESLRRTRVGRFGLDDALPLEVLEGQGGEAEADRRLLSLEDALGHLRAVEVSAADAEDLRLGRQGPLLRIPPGQPGEHIRVTGPAGLVAVAACECRLWNLERVFAAVPLRPAPCPAGGFMVPPCLSSKEEEERNEANRRD